MMMAPEEDNDESFLSRLLLDHADVENHNDNDSMAPPPSVAPSLLQEEPTTTTNISYLSDVQEAVIALTPLLPALLSICASLTLIRLLHKAHLTRPYRRILLGMSCYDVLNSITVSLQTFLIPANTSRRLWAVGNETTCQVLGFLFQFSYPSFMYFGCLSLYYVLVVKFGVRDATFARRVEPWLHVITLSWPTVTAILGLKLNLYGEVSIGAGCWISEQAITDDCNADCIASWTWIMGGLPFMLVFGMVLLNNVLIYCHVRKTIFAVTRPRQSTTAVVLQGTGSSTTQPMSSSDSTTHFGRTSSSRRQQQARRRQPQRHSLSMSPESQESKVRAVGVQALLYCIVFIMTYIWTIILRLASNDGAGPPQEPKLFPIMVLRAIFLPAMGLGTLLVYTRPRYVLLRATHSQQTRWWVLQQVLWYDHDDNASSSRTPPPHQQRHNGSSASSSASMGTNRFWMPSLRSLFSTTTSPSFLNTTPSSRSTSLVMTMKEDDDNNDNGNDQDNNDIAPIMELLPEPSLSVVKESDAEGLQSTSFHNTATTHTSNNSHNHMMCSSAMVMADHHHHDTTTSAAEASQHNTNNHPVPFSCCSSRSSSSIASMALDEAEASSSDSGDEASVDHENHDSDDERMAIELPSGGVVEQQQQRRRQEDHDDMTNHSTTTRASSSTKNEESAEHHHRRRHDSRNRNNMVMVDDLEQQQQQYACSNHHCIDGNVDCEAPPCVVGNGK